MKNMNQVVALFLLLVTVNGYQAINRNLQKTGTQSKALAVSLSCVFGTRRL